MAPYDGPIDPYSPHNLHDVLAGDIPVGETTEFYGLHLIAANEDGGFTINPDGHIGSVDQFNADDYDGILELVDYLHTQWHDFWVESTEEEKIEKAGKLVTREKERAEEEPEKWMYIPKGGIIESEDA